MLPQRKEKKERNMGGVRRERTSEWAAAGNGRRRGEAKRKGNGSRNGKCEREIEFGKHRIFRRREVEVSHLPAVHGCMPTRGLNGLGRLINHNLEEE